ncbi:MAG TPA: sugar nucleotide-binding protein, partial [Burkholderiales bacterium]
MRILLTGRNGQVGFELQDSLRFLGTVVATDRASLDFCDGDALRRVVRQTKPDIIVNAVAYTAVALSVLRSRSSWRWSAPGLLLPQLEGDLARSASLDLHLLGHLPQGLVPHLDLVLAGWDVVQLESAAGVAHCV